MTQLDPCAGVTTAREIPHADVQPHGLPKSIDSSPSSESAANLVAVRWVIAARRTREAMINAELFGDAAWDILLALYAATLGQRRIATSELCIAAAVPSTTALRWIDKLESLELLLRKNDPLDRRRMWVELSAKGKSNMRSYFQKIRPRLSMM
jgi:DNA-binding MarR family transcriptional regulator